MPEDLVRLAADHGTGVDAVCRHVPGFGFTLSSSLFVLPEEGRPRCLFAPGPPCVHAFTDLATRQEAT